MRTSLLLAAVLATTGCNDKSPSSATTGSATGSAASTGSGAAPPAVAAPISKPVPSMCGLGAAIDASTGRPERQRLAAAVRAWRGPGEGPDREGQVWVGKVDQASCVTKLKEAMAIKPAIADLDAVMVRYGNALEQVMPLANEATDYFEQDRHLDDGAAKGKELHPRLLASFDAFWAADRALRDVVQARNRALKEADLALLAKDPALRGDYVRARVLLLAEDVLLLSKAPELSQIDAAGFAAKSAELDKAITDLTAHSTTVDSKDTTLDRRAGEFMKAVLAMARRLREAAPYDKYEKLRLSEGSTDVDGSSPQLVAKYNELIGEANLSAARRR